MVFRKKDLRVVKNPQIFNRNYTSINSHLIKFVLEVAHILSPNFQQDKEIHIESETINIVGLTKWDVDEPWGIFVQPECSCS